MQHCGIAKERPEDALPCRFKTFNDALELPCLVKRTKLARKATRKRLLTEHRFVVRRHTQICISANTPTVAPNTATPYMPYSTQRFLVSSAIAANAMAICSAVVACAHRWC